MSALLITHYVIHIQKGQAALAFVFLVGSIVILVGVTIGFLASSFVNSSFGFSASQRALATANAGANDAYIRVLRNKDFSDVVGYSLPLGENSATVTVTQDSPSVGVVTVLSIATVSFHTRKVQMTLSVSSSTGSVELIGRRELQ
ncbi:MAG: hypothetical protein NUV53_01345 [Patescibacteria group bacterium]|nr:hypothetical protein [Patescibacteria group bacterium]